MTKFKEERQQKCQMNKCRLLCDINCILTKDTSVERAYALLGLYLTLVIMF